MSDVAITGFGMHGALGDQDQALDALVAGGSAAARHEFPGISGFPEVMAAPAPPIDVGAFLQDRKLAKYMSPATQMAVVAAGRALASARLLNDPGALQETALFVATGPIAFDLSSLTSSAEACSTANGGFDLRKMGTEGLRLCHPLMPFKMLLNMPLAAVSIAFGLRGDNFVVYPGADQTGVALETAWRGIRNGRFERALVGASVQGLSPLPLADLLRKGRVALPGAEHSGFVATDQAAFVVLERAEAQAEPGATEIARIRAVAVTGPGGRDEIPDAWASLAEGGGADAVVWTGLADPEQRRDEEARAARSWAWAPPASGSFDRNLGYGGASSLISAMGLSATLARRTGGWHAGGLSRLRDWLVLSSAPEEGRVACRLRCLGATP